YATTARWVGRAPGDVKPGPALRCRPAIARSSGRPESPPVNMRPHARRLLRRSAVSRRFRLSPQRPAHGRAIGIGGAAQDDLLRLLRFSGAEINAFAE